MAEEQVLRSEPPPPPPPKANDNQSSGGGGGGEQAGDDKLVFWVERLTACLVINCWVPSDPCYYHGFYSLEK
ncbi:hypothetical protein RHMOL_Rhmol05G0063500 [Rhododendron molle]|uniref:Uncharacterized protein n=1 Tax=Rhododendron molle TaxID=49168 RepID=A0ACC0NN56_RHOML|nr:hypothetical protein RHMOL_Rhmol05G0063500 [Rhododendron molle]